MSPLKHLGITVRADLPPVEKLAAIVAAKREAEAAAIDATPGNALQHIEAALRRQAAALARAAAALATLRHPDPHLTTAADYRAQNPFPAGDEEDR